ncbi:MAG: aminoglycoside phosphotransferase family protein [Actinomycetota bacterium]|nr:aminoglycoside phosphotransferase family protein [Actinomycetota bacterium]
MDAPGADRAAALNRAAMLAVPPPTTLAWLLTRLDAAELVTVDVMRGGSTAAMHRVTVRRADGTRVTVVLRRYAVADALLESAPVALQEITALGLAAIAPVPTPELLAADPHAEETDVPAVVMSFLDGKPLWEPKRRRDWLDQLVDALLGFHAIEIPDKVNLPAIRRSDQLSYAPPKWAEHARVWETAVEVFHDLMPKIDIGFAHRDFHPGNTLWRRNELTGVVDWQAACRGPVSIDPAHLRMNLLLYDATLAEEFRLTWQRRSGRPYHPWADVMCIIGTLDSLRDHPPGSASRHNIEAALTQAVGDLRR